MWCAPPTRSLRGVDSPVQEPTQKERAALAAGRAQHARGEFVTFDEIRRELAAELLAKRPKKSAKASA
jgi:predicted transcriptional regulator